MWTIENYPIKELASGENLSINTYTIKGHAGPHIHIQASVHGAELQGNAVILQLMEKLKNKKINGSITFIPLANPYATNNKHGTYTYGRYNPVTGDNWNRNYVDVVKASGFDMQQFVADNKSLPWHELRLVFKAELDHIIDSHIQKLVDKRLLAENNKLNLILQKLAAKADGVLDLHTGPVATRYLYSAEYEKEISYYLKFKHILVIPDEFGGAMDEAAFMPWVHLRNELEKHGRDITLDIESFTLEFGSEESFCMEDADKDVESILNYLKYKGVLEEEPESFSGYVCKLADYRTLFSPHGGLVDYHFKPGDRFKENDVLASFYQFKNLDPQDPIQSSRQQFKATTDGIIINRCPSSAVHQGMELYQVMTNLEEFQL
ncbi:MAG: succinylglutamate desuccinylase [Halobacteriovoraceae bacterium]|nr:succinylglutamate desuccinylase [Halobacteriovoraceae bacterium]|tara:strand:- start:9071 stop:10201 length:1131 start_codon:yes stop_codon:yes gene_type:complete